LGAACLGRRSAERREADGEAEQGRRAPPTAARNAAEGARPRSAIHGSSTRAGPSSSAIAAGDHLIIYL